MPGRTDSGPAAPDDLLAFDAGQWRAYVAPASHGDPRDPAAVLLAGALLVADGADVLDLNAGAGLAGAVAAVRTPAGQVRLATATTLDLAAAERTVMATQVRNARVHLSHGTAALPDTRADVALVRLPKGAWPTRQLIWDAFRALAPGGRLYLAGGGDEGIRPAVRSLAALFGNATVLAYRQGHRVATATRSADPAPIPAAFADPLLDHEQFHTYSATARGATYAVHTRPGVFAWEGLDAGTAALIATMELHAGDRVLDLGCGCGIVGAVAGRLVGPAGAVTLVDVAADALRASARTLAANEIGNAVVVGGDGAAAVAGQQFDVVVTNPPFHAGRVVAYDTATRFISGAAGVLRPGGRFCLVANRFLPYEPEIARVFGGVEVIWSDARYKVLMGRVAVRPQRRAETRQSSPPAYR